MYSNRRHFAIVRVLYTSPIYPEIDWAGFNVSTHLGDRFTGQKIQPTVSKYWRQGRYKSKENPEKANNTKYSNTIKTHANKNTASPLVYTNTMGWLGDGAHRGQGRQAWTAVGLLLRYLEIRAVIERSSFFAMKTAKQTRESFDINNHIIIYYGYICTQNSASYSNCNHHKLQ